MTSSKSTAPVALVTEEVIEDYISGKCMYLAAALSRHFGWEIRVAQELPDTPDSYIGHAWCVEPTTGYCVDIDGLYPHDINGWIHPGAKLLTNLGEQELLHLTMTTGGYPFTAQYWEDAVVEAQAVVTQYLVPKIGKRLLEIG